MADRPGAGDRKLFIRSHPYIVQIRPFCIKSIKNGPGIVTAFDAPELSASDVAFFANRDEYIFEEISIYLSPYLNWLAC